MSRQVVVVLGVYVPIVSCVCDAVDSDCVLSVMSAVVQWVDICATSSEQSQ